MSDTNYILKAIELADGWEYERDEPEPEYVYLSAADGTYWHMDEESIPLTELPRIFKDALAAQLVRQVDALEPTYRMFIGSKGSHVQDPVDSYCHASCEDQGRTMNTIRAIVDSGVLDPNHTLALDTEEHTDG